MNTAPTPDPTTEEDIQRQLSGAAFHGPLRWQGRELAPLSRGLRECFFNVTERSDSDQFAGVALCLVLADAYAVEEAEKVRRRAAIVAATDERALFRARVSITLDGLDPADVDEAIAHFGTIFGLIEKAEATSTDGKKKAPAAEPGPMKTPSSAGASPRKRAGRSTTSAGS